MKKYKKLLSEQSFGTSDTSKIASSSAGKTVSSGTLTDFGAGRQTLSGFSATQAQAPLSTSYSSTTGKGNAITQYKQGNVKAQKNYFTTNVVGKKQPFRADDDDERDAIERPDLSIVPSSIETLNSTPFTSRDLEDAIKSGDVSRVAQTISGNYAGAAYQRKDLLKSVFGAITGRGTGDGAPGRVLALDGPRDPTSPGQPEEPGYEDQMDDYIDDLLESMIPRISFSIANSLAGLYFKVEDYEAQRKRMREYLNFTFGDGDGDGIPGQIEMELSSPEFAELLQTFLTFSPEELAFYGIDATLLQQFIDLAYTGDPFTAGDYSPEFVQFIRILYGLDDFIFDAPVGDGGGRPPTGGSR